MDHVESNNSNQNKRLNSKILPMNSESTPDMTIDNSHDSEALFWYYVLYAIGSYVVESSRSLQHNKSSSILLPDIDSENFSESSIRQDNIKPKTTRSSMNSDDFYDDPFTRLFCGYMILYTIGTIADSHEISTR